MKIVQGEYENGTVKFLEEVPQVKNKRVLITFFEEEDSEEHLIRSISLQQPQNFLNDYLADEKEDLYQEYLNNNNDNR